MKMMTKEMKKTICNVSSFKYLMELKLKDFDMNHLSLLKSVNDSRVVAPFVGTPFLSWYGLFGESKT